MSGTAGGDLADAGNGGLSRGNEPAEAGTDAGKGGGTLRAPVNVQTVFRATLSRAKQLKAVLSSKHPMDRTITNARNEYGDSLRVPWVFFFFFVFFFCWGWVLVGWVAGVARSIGGDMRSSSVP
jgi:hypothetical protein